MLNEQLADKLKPSRFPTMSARMAAIVSYRVGETFAAPVVAGLHTTADGGMLAVPVISDGTRRPAAFIATETDLRVNLSRQGMAAGLDEGEWAAYVDLVRASTGCEVGEHMAS